MKETKLIIINKNLLGEFFNFKKEFLKKYNINFERLKRRYKFNPFFHNTSFFQHI